MDKRCESKVSVLIEYFMDIYIVSRILKSQVLMINFIFTVKTCTPSIICFLNFDMKNAENMIARKKIFITCILNMKKLQGLKSMINCIISCVKYKYSETYVLIFVILNLNTFKPPPFVNLFLYLLVIKAMIFLRQIV